MRVLLLGSIACLACTSQDFPQWRGPNRDGVIGAALPKSWPENLKRAWKVPIGEGHSSPVTAGSRAFLISRQGEKEAVAAYEIESGKRIWQDTYEAPYKMNPAATRHGKGPKSTPVVAGGRLYTLGISGILSCYETESGRLRWRKEFSKEYPETSPIFGTAMSPLVDRGMLIAHVGGSNNGALTAFDAESGAVRWAWKGDGAAYASPVIADLAGVRQVITQSDKMIVGISEATGELLWSLPLTTPYRQNIVTPLLYKDVIILAGLQNPAFAVKLKKNGGKLETEKLWENADAGMYMSSPVLSGGRVYGFSNRNRGQFFCLDAGTGKTLWTGDPRQGENAAVLVSGDIVLSLTDDATLRVSRASEKGLELLRKYTVAENPAWAHPVPTSRGILIKDFDSLALWRAE